MLKEENYLTVLGWMITKEELSGNELLCYALLYGFTQNGEWCNCTHQYIADWLNVSRRTVISILQSLLDKGKIEKKDEDNHGMRFCKYRALTSLPVKNLHTPCEESSHNDIYIDITKNKDTNVSLSDSESDDESENINYAGLIKYWNEQTKGVWGKLINIENKRKQLVRARIRTYGKKEFMRAIQLACTSQLCLNSTWFNFDWMIKPNNFDKLITGNYNKQQSENTSACVANPYEMIDPIGNRYYLQGSGKNKVVIPADAPPRPDQSAFWSNTRKEWYYV